MDIPAILSLQIFSVCFVAWDIGVSHNNLQILSLCIFTDNRHLVWVKTTIWSIFSFAFTALAFGQLFEDFEKELKAGYSAEIVTLSTPADKE